MARSHFAASPVRRTDRGQRSARRSTRIATLDGPFDLVFIDADKSNYLNYYEAVLPKLADDGLIAVDNTLWSGQVLDESDTSDDTVAIRAVQRPRRRRRARRVRAADRPRRRHPHPQARRVVATVAELTKAHTTLTRAGGRAPRAARRQLGDAVRPLLLRPAAVRPAWRARGTSGRFVSSARCGRARARPCTARTWSATRSTRPTRPARRPRVAAAARSSRARLATRPRRAGARAVHPGALAGPAGRRADPGVAGVARPAPPGELERVYVSVFERFARMIVERRLPVRQRRRSRSRRRHASATARCCSTRRAGSSTRRPTRVNALHRMGDQLQHRRHDARRAGRRRARREDRVRHGVAGHGRDRSAATTSSCCCAASRCSTAATVTGGAGAAPRRLRPAPAGPADPVEGRHDPRDPPPGEEQPADDLVAAAAAGPPRRGRSGPRRARGGRAPHPRHRPRARVLSPRGRASRCRSTRSSPSCCGWARSRPARSAAVHFKVTATPACCRRAGGHAARGRADRAAPERRPSTPSPSAPRARVEVAAARRARVELSATAWPTTASARPRRLRRRDRALPSLGLSIVRDLVGSQLRGTIDMRTDERHPGRSSPLPLRLEVTSGPQRAAAPAGDYSRARSGSSLQELSERRALPGASA